MIDAALKRSLGQMVSGVQVVAARHAGVTRAYTSHWVTQVAFDAPLVMASVSPRHDTHPVMAAAGRWTVSVLAADQVEVGQYFGYPGRRFRHVATELLVDVDGHPVVDNCVSWFSARTVQRVAMEDHELFFGRVDDYGYGRLDAPPLLYSPRHGWRSGGDKVRPPGGEVRDRLLERVRTAPPS